jgi:alpha-amylase
MHKINSIMMQYFHWYSPGDGTLWKQLAENAAELSKAGFTAVWLLPAYKGLGGEKEVGYGVYDLFDLGEFEQKGSIRTK